MQQDAIQTTMTIALIQEEDKKETAAIEADESSPGGGWVTSAPNIIVGLSVTRGIRLLRASARTVFLPPT